MCITKTA